MHVNSHEFVDAVAILLLREDINYTYKYHTGSSFCEHFDDPTKWKPSSSTHHVPHNEDPSL